MQVISERQYFTGEGNRLAIAIEPDDVWRCGSCGTPLERAAAAGGDQLLACPSCVRFRTYHVSEPWTVAASAAPLTLADGYAALAHAFPAGMSPVMRGVFEHMFYAGAMTVFDMLTSSPAMADDAPDAQAFALCARIRGELIAFVQHAKAGRAGGES